MITIHATKKLYAKLPLDENGCIVSKGPEGPFGQRSVADNPLSGWHANLIVLQRRNCIVLVHDETRFPLFMPGLLKADLAGFNRMFPDTLMNTLLKSGADEYLMDAAAALLAPCQFDTDCNRSVQGTMNQMKGDLEHMLWMEQVNVTEITGYRHAAWLSDRPCNTKDRKDFILPRQEMLDLLSNAAPRVLDGVPRNNVVHLSDFRKG